MTTVVRAYRILNRWDEWQILKKGGWKLLESKKLAPLVTYAILTKTTPYERLYRVYLLTYDAVTDTTRGVQSGATTSLTAATDRVSRHRAEFRHLAFMDRIART